MSHPAGDVAVIQAAMARITPAAFGNVRDALAGLSGDISSDAVGTHAPQLEEIYAPETHAATLDPGAPIVQGARGTGKSFWAGVLGSRDLRQAAHAAYPRLNLPSVDVEFGYTGIGGPQGIDREKLDGCVPEHATLDEARFFFWSTVLRAVELAPTTSLPALMPTARNVAAREARLSSRDRSLRDSGRMMVVLYDALDTMAATWPRRRLLTQALLEVVWAMRAFPGIRMKLFLRPDQLEDDSMQFVELPKLRTGAVRLTWSGTDLYGLLFARLALGDANESFGKMLSALGRPLASRDDILARRWSLCQNPTDQAMLMTALTGPFMSDGAFGFKKGNTYDWPTKHLGDAFGEVTPRSFLGLMIAAANYGTRENGRVMMPSGLQHGLRAASKTRVDQLHQEFPWIKGVLAPLAGLLLPQNQQAVFKVWRKAGTLDALIADAPLQGYLPPAPPGPTGVITEDDLYIALERIGVMKRRPDGRADMPDLFRVAAKLLKKGGTAPW